MSSSKSTNTEIKARFSPIEQGHPEVLPPQESEPRRNRALPTGGHQPPPEDIPYEVSEVDYGKEILCGGAAVAALSPNDTGRADCSRSSADVVRFQ